MRETALRTGPRVRAGGTLSRYQTQPDSHSAEASPPLCRELGGLRSQRGGGTLTKPQTLRTANHPGPTIQGEKGGDQGALTPPRAQKGDIPDQLADPIRPTKDHCPHISAQAPPSHAPASHKGDGGWGSESDMNEVRA